MVRYDIKPVVIDNKQFTPVVHGKKTKSDEKRKCLHEEQNISFICIVFILFLHHLY